jgi:hypothetical protein
MFLASTGTPFDEYWFIALIPVFLIAWHLGET